MVSRINAAVRWLKIAGLWQFLWIELAGIPDIYMHCLRAGEACRFSKDLNLVIQKRGIPFAKTSILYWGEKWGVSLFFVLIWQINNCPGMCATGISQWIRNRFIKLTFFWISQSSITINGFIKRKKDNRKTINRIQKIKIWSHSGIFWSKKWDNYRDSWWDVFFCKRVYRGHCPAPALEQRKYRKSAGLKWQNEWTA